MKRPDLEVDIGSVNFDEYFYSQATSASRPERELLPSELFSTIYGQQGGEVKKKYTDRLTFLERLYVLWKMRKKDFFIVIYDEEKGIGISEFEKAAKDRDVSVDAVKKYAPFGGFVLGSKELVMMLDYVNDMSGSPAMHFLIKSKRSLTPRNGGKAEFNSNIREIVKLVTTWESRRSEIANTFDVDFTQMLCLMALYLKPEVQPADLYKDWFSRTFRCSKAMITRSLSTCVRKGYATHHGVRQTHSARYKITAFGIEAVNKIVLKILMP